MNHKKELLRSLWVVAYPDYRQRPAFPVKTPKAQISGGGIGGLCNCGYDKNRRYRGVIRSCGVFGVSPYRCITEMAGALDMPAATWETV